MIICSFPDLHGSMYSADFFLTYKIPDGSSDHTVILFPQY